MHFSTRFRYLYLPWSVGLVVLVLSLVFETSADSQPSIHSKVSYVSGEITNLPKQPATIREMPFYPGCEHLTGKEKRACSTEKMYRYIYDNTAYPAGNPSHRTAGIVSVDFLINAKGVVRNIRIIRAPDQRHGEDVIRILKNMEADGIRWEPGSLNGKPVGVKTGAIIRYNMIWAGERPGKD